MPQAAAEKTKGTVISCGIRPFTDERPACYLEPKVTVISISSYEYPCGRSITNSTVSPAS